MHMRRALRLLGAGLYVAGYGICALVYPLAPTRVRVSLRQGWARGVLKLLGVRMRVDDLKIAPGSLVVANHVSWLDAVVLQGAARRRDHRQVRNPALAAARIHTRAQRHPFHRSKGGVKEE